MLLLLNIKENELTQEMAAKKMGVQSSRIADVCRVAGFSIDALVAMAARAGWHSIKTAA